MRFSIMRSIVTAVLAIGLTIDHSGATTQTNDDLRTGWYPNQPTLTPSLVSGGTFGQLFATQLIGQVYVQPLVANGTLLVATEANWIYGLDPETGAVRWLRNVGAPWNAADLSCSDLAPTIGITGTPVIDDASGTAYFTSKTYLSGSSGPAAWDMHAVDLATGQERPAFPVRIQGAAQNNPNQTFNATHEMQRPGLLLMGGIVYAGFGAHCDAGPWQGWIVGVSTQGSIRAMWVAVGGTGTSGAGIWQSGGGLVSDGPGRILFVTGNGGAPTVAAPGNQPPASLGESVVRLQVQPDGTLVAMDFFAPFDAANLDSWDADFSSGAPLALPSPFFGTQAYPHLLVAVGKQGYVYLLDRDSLGGTKQGPGNGDDVVGRIGPYGGVWSHPTAWPGDGGYVYMPTASGGNSGSGSQGFLRYYKYGLDGTGKPTLSLVGSSSDAFGFSSSCAVVTSDATSSGSALVWLVWAPNGSGSGAQLRCYDPVPVNGVPVLRWSAPVGTAAKFAPPGVGPNGRIYVGTRDGRILGFGAPITPNVTGSTLVFQPTTIGSDRTLTEVLTAQRTVTVNALSSSNAQFTLGASTPSLPAALTLGQTLSVPVTFTPTGLGLQAGSLIVNESDGSQQLFGVQGNGQNNGPLLTATPVAVSFGGTTLGGHLASVVTFANQGSASLTVGGPTLPGPPFSASGAPAAGYVMNPGDSVAVNVFFDPTVEGYFTDDLTVDSTGGSETVPLSGSASPPGALQITPLNLHFGPISVGSGATATFRLENTGASALTITKSKTPVGGQFVNLTNLFEGTTMAPGQVLIEKVRFAPGGTGDLADTWVINSDAPGGVQTVTFDGTGAVANPVPGGWRLVYVDSQETTGEDGRGTNAFDGLMTTFWHTQWYAADPPLPHEIQVDLNASYQVNGFRYLPRQDAFVDGRIGQYEFYVSTDGTNWGTPAAAGTFTNDAFETEVRFASKTGRYVRLRALTSTNGDPYTAVAELGVLGDTAPTANAGPDQSVTCYLPAPTVVLDGTASLHAPGQSISYLWTQTAGPAVTLNGATTPTPSFAAPIAPGGATLTFQLQVTGGQASTVDSTTVIVPDLTDTDGDVAPACNDCSPTNATIHPPLEATGLRFASDKTTLTWDPVAGATGYDVESGSMWTPFVFTHDCALQGLTATTGTLTAVPSPGTAFYYLVRATSSCGLGNSGAASDGRPRTNAACGAGGPPNTQTVTFNDLPPNSALNGIYPTGTISWSQGAWWSSGPWRSFTTNSVSFNGAGPTSAGFTFITPRILVRLDAFNGGTVSSTVTLSCDGNPTKQLVVGVNQVVTISTGWVAACSNAVIGSTNGWNTNFDNLVIH